MKLNHPSIIEDNNDIKSSDKYTISIFIAGIGAVGGTLVQQIKELQSPRFNLNIIGACNSGHVAWQPDIDSIQTDIALSKIPSDLDQITDELIRLNNGTLIFVDATGNEAVARQYHKLLSNGVHIATPSKRANTFGQKYFDQLMELTKSGKVHYKYETTVGAGLPVISTLQSLIESGDKITSISGVVSGTMTFIFNQLQQGVSFSEIVKRAKNDGYSEPDPRDDLSGEDVARKFLILARTCGYTFERDEIRVDSLVPEKLSELSSEEFLLHLPNYDAHWKSRNSQALVNNRRLRYIGNFSADGIIIGVKEVAADSPIGGLKGTDNLIQIYTRRYATSPIIVQGPGAGKEVTAAGVLADIIAIAKKIV